MLFAQLYKPQVLRMLAYLAFDVFQTDEFIQLLQYFFKAHPPPHGGHIRHVALVLLRHVLDLPLLKGFPHVEIGRGNDFIHKEHIKGVLPRRPEVLLIASHAHHYLDGILKGMDHEDAVILPFELVLFVVHAHLQFTSPRILAVEVL